MLRIAWQVTTFACALTGLSLLTTACSLGGGRPQQSQSTANNDDKWFCQIDESGSDWVCVQDAGLAGNPKPERLPNVPSDRGRPAAGERGEPAPRPDQLPPGAALPSTPPDSAGLDEQVPTASSAIADTGDLQPDPPTARSASTKSHQAAVESLNENASETQPEHVRLAYNPQKPIPLTDLPADYYIVQLMAMSSSAQVEQYVRDHGLKGISAARVESGGAVYYVLLLGVYETRELAERASRSIPPPLDQVQPWVRRMGSFQRAMERAEAIAAGGTSPSANG